MNTHSKYADCRTELFALEAMFHGASVEVGREIYGCLTTDEVTKVLKREQIFEPVMDKVTEKIDFYMQHKNGCFDVFQCLWHFGQDQVRRRINPAT